MAAITRDAAESLGLAVGDDVHAVIKSTEVMVGKEYTRAARLARR